MAHNDSAVRDEVAELRQLLALAKAPGNVRDLTRLLADKEQALAAIEQQQKHDGAEDVLAPNKDNDVAMDSGENTPSAPAAAPPAASATPAPAKPSTHATKPSNTDDLNVYTEISRFGWEDEGYGKDKVCVYIMAGIDGVGDLPKDAVRCDFTKNSFDLKILGLHGKNYRLVKTYLDNDIVPAKSTVRIKKNRVTLLLVKADKNKTWLTLTEKNPGSKANKPASNDPGAGIMDMMKNMYDEGDENMKRTIAKAWTESRQKGGAAVDAGL